MESRNIPAVGGWCWAQLPGKQRLQSESDSLAWPASWHWGGTSSSRSSEAWPCLPDALEPCSSLTLSQGRWEMVGIQLRTGFKMLTKQEQENIVSILIGGH